MAVIKVPAVSSGLDPLYSYTMNDVPNFSIVDDDKIGVKKAVNKTEYGRMTQAIWGVPNPTASNDKHSFLYQITSGKASRHRTYTQDN